MSDDWEQNGMSDENQIKPLANNGLEGDQTNPEQKVIEASPYNIEDPLNEGEESFDVISFKTVDEIEKSIVESPFRAIYQTNNFLLPQIQDVVDESKTVNLRPEYQRRSRWTNKQKSLLIESFLLNVPVPPIFLFEADFARYEVMDGQQRLLAIREFFANQVKLTSLSILSPLNGRRYADLPPRTKRTLERASLSAIVLLKEARSALRDAHSERVLELKRFVFERLNTGGKHLNPQEIRNAVFSGMFNELVIDLARHPTFTEIWGIPAYHSYSDEEYESPDRKKNTLYRTMGDCQIVLRFFALRQRDAIKGSMRSILDKCMERHVADTEQEISQYRFAFENTLGLCSLLFDGKPFRLTFDSPPSESMYDAVMAAVDELYPEAESLIYAKAHVQRRYWQALSSSEQISRFSGRANTAADIRQRISSMTELLRSAIRDAGF